MKIFKNFVGSPEIFEKSFNNRLFLIAIKLNQINYLFF